MFAFFAYNRKMAFERLPEGTVSLYAELMDQLVRSRAELADVPENGSFVSKLIGGTRYWYLQRMEGDRRRQTYLGPESESLSAWMEAVTERRERTRPDTRRREQLVAMLVAGGATKDPAPVARVVRILAEAKLFDVGGMLVGTQAFVACANLLGVRFDLHHLRTQDVDVAHDPVVELSLADERAATSLLGRLRESEPAFFEVPSLDPKEPSTSFKVRGRDLRVDFLTPARGRETAPVFLSRFGVAAHPLPNLGYLLEQPVQACCLTGSGVLVTIPLPARLALHKLWTSTRRPATERSRAVKDVAQAEALFEVLLEDDPASVRDAWEATASRRGMRTAIRGALRGIGPDVRKGLGGAIG